MIRRIFMLALLTFATPLAAQSVKLKAHEIEILLSGNTAVGKWEGTAYRQYFDADGSTIFAQERARSTAGKWRIDVERDEYQSIWPRDAEWEGWYVMEYAGDFFWVSKDTPPTPFEVLEGQQLVAKPALDLGCQLVAEWMQGADLDVKGLVGSSQPVTCGASLGLGGTQSRHCAWAFAYRAPEALQAAKRLNERLMNCFGAPPAFGTGPLVNHPDSYDLQSYRTPYGSLWVSLKDKGALQKTYIFLRAEHRP